MIGSLGLFWSEEDGSMILSPCDEAFQEPKVAYFYIQVETESEYKHIRMDKWNTPVRTNNHFECTRFDTCEEAVEVVKKFNLVSTSHVHKVRLARVTGTYMWDDIVYVYCSLKNLGNGKFGLAISERM